MKFEAITMAMIDLFFLSFQTQKTRIGEIFDQSEPVSKPIAGGGISEWVFVFVVLAFLGLMLFLYKIIESRGSLEDYQRRLQAAQDVYAAKLDQLRLAPELASTFH